MSEDLDRLLKESLKKAGEGYRRHQSPQRRAEARQEFVRRVERRRWAFPFAVAVAAVGVVALVAFGVSALVDEPAGTLRDGTAEVAGPDAPYVGFPVDGDPVDLGVRDNGVWIADAAGGRLVHMDPATGDVVATLELGGSPRALAIGAGTVWVGDPSRGLLYRIDKRSDELIGDPIDVGGPSPSMSISVGTEGVWVISGDELRTIDLATSEVTVIETAAEPSDVAANLGTVWVLDGREGLLRLDPGTGARLGEPIPVRGITGTVFAAADGIWVGDRQDDTIVGVDPDTGRILVIAQIRGTYAGLAFDPNAMWVLSRAGGSAGYLTPLDAATGRPLRDPIELEGQPVEVATGAGAVWAALRGDRAIARIDPVSVIGEETSPGDS